MDQAVNERLAAETGLSMDQVTLLRKEIMKIGRNPMVESIEIVAIENGIDEDKARNLLEKHKEYMRKMDGLAEQFKVSAGNPNQCSPNQFSQRTSMQPHSRMESGGASSSTRTMVQTVYSDF